MGIIGSFQGYVDSPLYLYNKGVWSNLQTPGMTKNAGNTLSDTKDGIRLLSEKFEFGACRSNQTIDISTYKYLKVDINITPVSLNDVRFYGLIGVSQNANLINNSGLTSSVRNTEGVIFRGTLILDISSLVGYYYIYFVNFSANGSATIVANNIFLTTV